MTQKPLLIYLAGPYSPKLPNDMSPQEQLLESPRYILKNVNIAVQLGLEVIERGHIPFVPHLTYYLHMASTRPLPKQFWLDFDNVTLDRCDAILYFGQSFGADKELERAKKNKQKIFYHISEIPNLYTNGIKQDLIKVVYRSDLTKPTSTRLIAPRVVK